MSESKFRAKRKKMVWMTMYTEYNYQPGEMVYGSLLDLGGDEIYIVTPNSYKEDREYKEAPKEAEYIPVYRETVGQYTGLKDKNGTEVYDKDIFKVPDLYETPENTYPTYHYEMIEYREFAWHLGDQPLCYDYTYVSDECEIVGNIHDNPELLEVKQ